MYVKFSMCIVIYGWQCISHTCAVISSNQIEQTREWTLGTNFRSNFIEVHDLLLLS